VSAREILLLTRVEIWPFPLLSLSDFTAACTTAQVVIYLSVLSTADYDGLIQ